MDIPEVEYARSGGVAIAYQVVGDASQDVVWIRGDINDMLSSWERPEFVERMTKLTRFSRVMLFDKRGTGLSDHVLATSTVGDLVAGSDIAFEEQGEHELKGVPGRWRVLKVVG
jgi:hypothetical protein